jgi:surface antigen
MPSLRSVCGFHDLGVRLVPVVALSLALAACTAQSAPGPKTQVGAATGAAAGGLLGAALGGETEGIIAGVLLGGLLGGALGNALDNADRAYASRNAYHALETTPSGTTSTWQNPDSGHSGTTTPTRTYQQHDGTYCREFQQTVTIGGKSERAFGTACRMPDGSWQIVS